MGNSSVKIKLKKKTNNHCSICNGKLGYSESFIQRYPNLVCKKCDEKAVSKKNTLAKHGGEDPHFIKESNEKWAKEGKLVLPADGGDNPVYIEGKKCWRRYRFGGWVTMRVN